MKESLENNLITINSRKFDGEIHRSWQAYFIERQNSLLVFLGRFEKEIIHPNLGIIRRGTISYEYYWLDRWYNIFQFHEPEGDLRNFYCNISEPPIFENNVLNYVDFEIDLLIWKDFSYEILDIEEFEENKKKFNYSSEIVKKVYQSVSAIETLIHSRSFPFDLRKFEKNELSNNVSKHPKN